MPSPALRQDSELSCRFNRVLRMFSTAFRMGPQFFDGQGVGLTVARNIARRLGGDVVLDTTKETPGARFVLSLPI